MATTTQPLLGDSARNTVLYATSLGMKRASAAACAGCEQADIELTAQFDPEFRRQLAMAEKQPEYKALEEIWKQSEKNWRAAAWLLEQNYPDDYGKRKLRAPAPDSPAKPAFDNPPHPVDTASRRVRRDTASKRRGAASTIGVDSPAKPTFDDPAFPVDAASRRVHGDVAPKRRGAASTEESTRRDAASTVDSLIAQLDPRAELDAAGYGLHSPPRGILSQCEHGDPYETLSTRRTWIVRPSGAGPPE